MGWKGSPTGAAEAPEKQQLRHAAAAGHKVREDLPPHPACLFPLWGIPEQCTKVHNKKMAGGQAQILVNGIPTPVSYSLDTHPPRFTGCIREIPVSLAELAS